MTRRGQDAYCFLENLSITGRVQIALFHSDDLRADIEHIEPLKRSFEWLPILRALQKTESGIIRTSCKFLKNQPESPVNVLLLSWHDTSITHT